MNTLWEAQVKLLFRMRTCINLNNGGVMVRCPDGLRASVWWLLGLEPSRRWSSLHSPVRLEAPAAAVPPTMPELVNVC